LDGKDIDWSANAARGFIDGTIWAAIVLISLAVPAHISRIASRLSVMFLLIQAIAITSVAVIAPDASYLHDEPIENESSVLEFSAERNVVILVLDSFQGDVFHGIINDDRHYEDMFDGFTYYRNSLSGFSHTPANVLLILTGQYYDNLVPFKSFLKAAFSPNSAPKVLKDNGYQVDLVCTSGFGIEKILHADRTIATSQVGIRNVLGQNVELKEAAFVFDLTLFRYLPHFLKKYIYNKQSWVFSNIASGDFFGEFPAGPYRDDIDFIRAIERQAQSNSEKPTLLGIYEKTMILVLSDHGFGIEVEEDQYGENGLAQSAIKDSTKGRALSLFLVKPFNSAGALKISDAPVSLGDVAKTIVTELALEAEIPGVSVFDANTSDIRERRYLFHTWETGGWSWIYLPPMSEYLVSGRSWLDESWHPTNKLYEEGEVKDIPPDTHR
jgi:hypothetical protein